MLHTGNKTQKTIMSEEVFVNVMRTIGLNVFYEVAFRNAITGNRTIDFVVGEPYSKDGMCYCGMVGVELKTRREDLINARTGKNIACFPFNYFLVTDDILNDTIRFIGGNSAYNHVGIIVLNSDSTVEIYKTAGFCGINQEYYGELKNDIELNQYEEYCDSISCAFAKLGRIECGTIHNFRNDTTYSVKYECFYKTTIVNYEKTRVSGTMAKNRLDSCQIKMSCI